MAFKEIKLQELSINPVTVFSEGWALLTAGDKNRFNSMTVSWGAIGEIWSKPTVFVFVRHSRYTYGFMDNGEYFTVSCFLGKNRNELTLFGRKSGRDCDKYKETGLTPVFDENFVYCDDAEYVFLCRKTAKTEFDSNNFYDNDIPGCYSDNDYHSIFTGEIVKILKKTSE